MKEEIIKRLYDFWSKIDNNDNLLKEITDNVNDGITGAEILLDWCREDYDKAQRKYMELHSINIREMQKVMEENFGNYEFMYNELPYVEELDEIWDLCNEYFDYCKEMEEK